MERLALSRDLDEVLSLINDSMRDCLDAERASVLCYDSVRDELFAAQAHGVNEPLRFPAHTGLAGQAVITKQIINVQNCYADPRFSPEVDRRTGFRTRTMLSVPLMSLDGKLEGVAQILNKNNGGVFTQEDEIIARALASQAAVAIRRSSLLEAERRKIKMETDLRVAREIQNATLPSELPSIPGYSVAARLAPAEETAGDCYDVILNNHRLWLFVADAAGHGVGPALAVAQAHAMFRLGVRAGIRMSDLLDHINSGLAERLPIGMFVCAFLGELDTRTGALRYAAAGLSPVLFVCQSTTTPDSIEFESCPGTLPPLGIDPVIERDAIVTKHLQPGDSIVVSTDGVYEQPNGEGVRAGEEGVIRGIRSGWCPEKGGSMDAREMVRAMITWLEGYRGTTPQTDDQTSLVITRDRAGVRTPHR